MKQRKKVKQNESLSKQMRLMKKRFNRTLAVVGILIMALSLSGCEKLAETNVSAETKGTKQTVGEITASVNSEETAVVPDFKITDWTMKDLVKSIEVDGDKFSLPCTVSEIGTDYELENVIYLEDMQKTAATLCKESNTMGLTYFDGDVTDNALDSEIKFLFLGGAYDLPEFNIMGITDKSTRSDVINILGSPNMRTEESDRHLQYGFSENEYIIIDFSEEDPDKLCLFFIIYNTEE